MPTPPASRPPSSRSARGRSRSTATLFYPTGGGQPHDTGTLAGLAVDRGAQGGRAGVAHASQGGPLPERRRTRVEGEIDWERRHRLMRTHTALHVLCGVIWNEWRVPVTGGNMEPLSARMDFEFDPVPEGFAARIEELVNAELAADRPITVEFLPRDTAVQDARSDPHEGEHDSRGGDRDPRGRHRRPRQAGRRRHARAQHRRGRSVQGAQAREQGQGQQARRVSRSSTR